jgi:hypothetical protein
VPQTAQVPFIACRPFFIVTSWAFFISVFFLHLTQYASDMLCSFHEYFIYLDNIFVVQLPLHILALCKRGIAHTIFYMDTRVLAIEEIHFGYFSYSICLIFTLLLIIFDLVSGSSPFCPFSACF